MCDPDARGTERNNGHDNAGKTTTTKGKQARTIGLQISEDPPAPDFGHVFHNGGTKKANLTRAVRVFGANNASCCRRQKTRHTRLPVDVHECSKKGRSRFLSRNIQCNQNQVSNADAPPSFLPSFFRMLHTFRAFAQNAACGVASRWPLWLPSVALDSCGSSYCCGCMMHVAGLTCNMSCPPVPFSTVTMLFCAVVVKDKRNTARWEDDPPSPHPSKDFKKDTTNMQMSRKTKPTTSKSKKK